MIRHDLDGTTVRTRAEFLAAVADALSFPDWFGHNLDALYDSLRDLSWLPPGEHVLVWHAPEVLADADLRAYAAVTAVLADAAEPGRFAVAFSSP